MSQKNKIHMKNVLARSSKSARVFREHPLFELASYTQLGFHALLAACSPMLHTGEYRGITGIKSLLFEYAQILTSKFH